MIEGGISHESDYLAHECCLVKISTNGSLPAVGYRKRSIPIDNVVAIGGCLMLGHMHQGKHEISGRVPFIDRASVRFQASSSVVVKHHNPNALSGKSAKVWTP